MVFAGGDPVVLSGGATQLEGLVSDLGGDAMAIKDSGRRGSVAAGDPEVARLIESALATSGGVLVAAAAVAHGLAEGASTAGDQLVSATGGAGGR